MRSSSKILLFPITSMLLNRSTALSLSTTRKIWGSMVSATLTIRALLSYKPGFTGIRLWVLKWRRVRSYQDRCRYRENNLKLSTSTVTPTTMPSSTATIIWSSITRPGKRRVAPCFFSYCQWYQRRTSKKSISNTKTVFTRVVRKTAAKS